MTDFELTEVVVDPAALSRLLRGPDGPVWRQMIIAGDTVKAGAVRRVGVRTGRLRDSIVKRIINGPDGPEVWVGSEEPHAYLHHEGTEPHRIEGNPVLSFMWNGDRVFFRSVQHPGTRPNRFLTDSLQDLRSKF